MCMKYCIHFLCTRHLFGPMTMITMGSANFCTWQQMYTAPKKKKNMCTCAAPSSMRVYIVTKVISFSFFTAQNCVHTSK